MGPDDGETPAAVRLLGVGPEELLVLDLEGVALLVGRQLNVIGAGSGRRRRRRLEGLALDRLEDCRGGRHGVCRGVVSAGGERSVRSGRSLRNGFRGERNRSAGYVRIGVYIGVGEARCRVDPVFSEREDGKPGVSSWPGSGSVGNHAVGRCNGLIGGAGGEVPGPVRRGALGYSWPLL
jgi:hypothetical protein